MHGSSRARLGLEVGSGPMLLETECDCYCRSRLPGSIVAGFGGCMAIEGRQTADCMADPV